MGVGHPLSIKMKNVHLPHPHPNGGLRDPSLEERLVLPLCFAAVVVELSKWRTPPGAAVRDGSSGVVFLLPWLRTSVKRGVY